METVIGRLTSFAASTECITKALEENAAEASIIQNVSSVADVLQSTWMQKFSKNKDGDSKSHENFQLKFFSKQLEEVVVGLWNATVARQCAKTLNSCTTAVLRQLCYDLLTCPLCCVDGLFEGRDLQQKPHLHRRIMMAIKAGKNWLDVAEYGKAEAVLLKAKFDIEKLRPMVLNSDDEQRDFTSSVSDQELSTLNKHQLAVLCYLSESVWRHDDGRSYAFLQEASSLKFLDDCEENEYMSEKKRILVTSYNFGLNAAEEHKLDHAIKWLQFSYECGKQKKIGDVKLMAQILRLLAHVYCETGSADNVAKALCAVELANGYVPHPAGLHLRLKILAKDSSTADSDVRAVLVELLRHAELSIDLGLTACRCLNSSGRYDICEWGLKELLSRFTGSRHVGRVHAERLHAAIQRLPTKDAVDFTDKFLEDNDVIMVLDDEARKGIQLLLWEQAARCHEAGKMDLCLSWYDQSLRLFLFGKSFVDIKKCKESSENVAKLHRNRAACLLSLGRLTEAEDAARKALDFNEDCLLSYFTTFQVATARADQTEAIKAISQLMARDNESILKKDGDPLDTRHALICLAAQHSLEKGQRQVALVTLYHLATSGKHDMSKLVAYRCLVRLYLTMCDTVENESSKDTDLKMNEEMNDVPMEESGSFDSLPNDRSSLMDAAIQRVNDAFKVLVHLRKNMKAADMRQCAEGLNVLVLPGNEKETIDAKQFENEVTWFMKITWNMALQFNDNPSKMKGLFYLCKELLDLLEPDQGVLLRQKTCLLMCAACGLAVARNSGFKDQRTELEEVVRILTGCRSICGLLAEVQGSENPRKEDKSPTLLALYHFEALAKLTKFSENSEPREVENLFNEIRQLQHADAKTFETVAALSMESPAYHPEICKMALKLSLKSLNLQVGPDTSEDARAEIFKRKSSLYRSLIETCLKEGSSSDPSTKEECRTYFNEVYQIVQNSKRTFPEVDKLWFSIRSWNVGVRLFTACQVVEAEKWCSLSLRLLAQLERFKDSYESHMNLVYQEILAKKDAMKSRTLGE